MIYKPLNTAIRLYLNHRFKRIEAMRTDGLAMQQGVLKDLWAQLRNTDYVSSYGARRLEDLPVTNYEDLKPLIDQMLDGESNVLLPNRVDWFSKSSGTTSDRSKYIPVSDELFYQNMISCSWDTTAIIYNRWQEANLFAAKSLIMGGALSPYPNRKGVMIGDVSAIMIKRIPAIGKPFYAPDPDIALVQDWDEKLDKILKTTLSENVVMFGGVPTWNIVLFDKILDYTGKSNILEVWPNLNVYVHGGVSFAPYKNKFKEYLPKDDFKYIEVYNASEGYFGVQDTAEEGMLLMLDNAIYYEFIPLDKVDDPYGHIIPLEGVKIDQNYAMVITTAGGFMRYMPGDTIQFSSVSPYRFAVTGRTSQYINTFGEEVMVSNTDQALSKTCKMFSVKIKEYTVAPKYFDNDNAAGHQWLIEFESKPNSIEKFSLELDKNLREVNSDYDAKRYNDLALKPLDLVVVPNGTFLKWLDAKGKIGGQNKVPRLSNDRKYVEDILSIINP